jgi:tRNA threonylcarbamoyladenosine biosynthesis protein TsaE
MEVAFNLEEIHNAASRYLTEILSRKVVAVYGEMGAGKTTFIHAVCDLLKVTSVVGSPTYAIINEYSYPGGKIFHLDLYRLKDEEEAQQAGVEDCLYSGNICFIEWPERAPGILPEETLKLRIQAVNEGSRRVRIVDN